MSNWLEEIGFKIIDDDAVCPNCDNGEFDICDSQEDMEYVEWVCTNCGCSIMDTGSRIEDFDDDYEIYD